VGEVCPCHSLASFGARSALAQSFEQGQTLFLEFVICLRFRI